MSGLAGAGAEQRVRGDREMGEVDDFVKCCLVRLSDEASWLIGQIVAVDGGRILRV